MKVSLWMLNGIIAVALSAAIGCDDSGTSCDDGQSDCGGTCVDTSRDTQNCGVCGVECRSDQVCCDGFCIDPDTDPNNCGGCGNGCGGQRCFDGSCLACADQEACNGLDDDCDGDVDEDLLQDCDNACGQGTQTCNDDGTWSDCNAPQPEDEICDGEDNDCDGQVDEDLRTTFYRDADEDDFGSTEDTTEACEQPEGYVTDSTDCDDNEATINSDAEETCDGVDNNCDGTIDEGCTCTLGAIQPCGEGEDLGECEWGSQNCIEGDSGPVWGECTGGIRPVDESCDGLDNDCDDVIDDGLPEDSYEATTINDSCGAASGPLVADENAEDPIEITGTLYSADGSRQDEDWYHIHANETWELWCGTPFVSGECTYRFTVTLTPPAGATHTDWEICLHEFEDDDCSGAAVGTPICSEASDWDASSGRYEFTAIWDGVCAQDDDRHFYAAIRPTGSATINDCNEYSATFQLAFTDEDCE